MFIKGQFNFLDTLVKNNATTASNFRLAANNHFNRAFLQHEFIPLMQVALDVVNSVVAFNDTGGDCAGGQCTLLADGSRVCTSCSNGAKDGLETDVDCGGPECETRCVIGEGCLVDGSFAKQAVTFGSVAREVTQCAYDTNAGPADYDGALAAFVACRTSGSYDCVSTLTAAKDLQAQTLPAAAWASASTRPPPSPSAATASTPSGSTATTAAAASSASTRAASCTPSPGTSGGTSTCPASRSRRARTPSARSASKAGRSARSGCPARRSATGLGRAGRRQLQRRLRECDRADIDCGGTDCDDGCSPGSACTLPGDCSSGQCEGGKCISCTNTS